MTHTYTPAKAPYSPIATTAQSSFPHSSAVTQATATEGTDVSTQLARSRYLGHSFENAEFEDKQTSGQSLPDNLKAGMENISSIAMNDMRVDYNSSKSVQLQALAYTQGTEIHIAPWQERHLPPEAWHVVEQRGGAVQRSPLPPEQPCQNPATETLSASVGDHAIQDKSEMKGNRQVISVEQRPNQTGLPDGLRFGIESLSGISMDNVNVHYNSSQPAQLNALAYAQGSDIHVAPGQEQYLPHEAWHVVQQAQGRVKPTMQMKDGVAVNDDDGLEHEADVMGTRALEDAAQLKGVPEEPDLSQGKFAPMQRTRPGRSANTSYLLQRRVFENRGRPGFHSSLTGRDYTTREEAEAAEQEQQVLRQQEHPQVDFQFQLPPDGPPEPETRLSAALLSHPTHFGPIITTGGDVSSAQVNASAGQQVIPPTHRTAFSARNTHAMVFSQGADDIHVHSHSGDATPVSNISFDSHSPLDFYRQHTFMQGSPPSSVHLPDQRKSAHAEALAVHSDAFKSAATRNADELTQTGKHFDFDQELGVSDEPTDEEIQNLSMFLSLPPVKTTVAINRASCGHKGKSGYPGGCNQEMADSAGQYYNSLASNMKPELAFLATRTGLAKFGVSAAGPYKQQGNPRIMTNSGVDVDIHNAFDWNIGQGKPLSIKHQKYLETADPEKGEERRRKKRKRKLIGVSSQTPSFHKPSDPPDQPSGAGMLVS